MIALLYAYCDRSETIDSAVALLGDWHIWWGAACILFLPPTKLLDGRFEMRAIGSPHNLPQKIGLICSRESLRKSPTCQTAEPKKKL